tara:strand:+ start:191 stop:292 length:102 start_codon:yes stop_codon:yes gene_type:complete
MDALENKEFIDECLAEENKEIVDQILAEEEHGA